MNSTEKTLHFHIKEGVLRYIPNMPEEPETLTFEYYGSYEDYQESIQSIEVENHLEVKKWLIESRYNLNETIHTLTGDYKVEIKEVPEEDSGIDGSGAPYAKVDFKKVALISLESKKEEETYERIETLAKAALEEANKHTTLCITDEEEHAFIVGFNAGYRAKP